MTFSAWIKSSRKQLGMTLEELADRVPCAKSTLSEIERGLINPSLSMANAIAIALGVSLWRALKKIEDDEFAFYKPMPRVEGSHEADT